MERLRAARAARARHVDNLARLLARIPASPQTAAALARLTASADDDEVEEALLSLRVEWEHTDAWSRCPGLAEWDRVMSEWQNTVALLRALGEAEGR
jgi:hypothetical protein